MKVKAKVRKFSTERDQRLSESQKESIQQQTEKTDYDQYIFRYGRVLKKQSERTGIPYQTLINLYLVDCATSGKKLEIAWK